MKRILVALLATAVLVSGVLSISCTKTVYVEVTPTPTAMPTPTPTPRPTPSKTQVQDAIAAYLDRTFDVQDLYTSAARRFASDLEAIDTVFLSGYDLSAYEMMSTSSRNYAAKTRAAKREWDRITPPPAFKESHECYSRFFHLEASGGDAIASTADLHDRTLLSMALDMTLEPRRSAFYGCMSIWAREKASQS